MWFPDKRLQIVVISQQLGFISVRFLKIKLWWLWGPPDFSSCATTRFTVVALSENKYRMDCHEIRYGQSCPTHTQQQCQIQSQHNHPCCWISIADITETERNKSSALRFKSVIVCMVRWWSSISHAFMLKICFTSVHNYRRLHHYHRNPLRYVDDMTKIESLANISVDKMASDSLY